MMTEINCPHRSIRGDAIPVCQIVANVTGMSLEVCQTNDSACGACLKCDIPPQTPNFVVASMAIGAAMREQHPNRQVILDRMKPHLNSSPAPTLQNTPCVLRGLETRKQACKPCQAGSNIPVMVPVYRCPTHGECTLQNTGTHPKIQACVTCQERQAEYPQLQTREYPPEILAVLNHR